MVKLPCVYNPPCTNSDGTPWETPEAELNDAKELLQLHMEFTHKGDNLPTAISKESTVINEFNSKSNRQKLR